MKHIMEKNKIYQGDCLELMKQIEDKSIDLILCDLPYGTTACKWDVIIDLKEHIQIIRLIFYGSLENRVLKKKFILQKSQ